MVPDVLGRAIGPVGHDHVGHRLSLDPTGDPLGDPGRRHLHGPFEILGRVLIP